MQFHFPPLLFAVLSAVYLYPTVSFSRRGSHDTTVAALQGFLFVTATNGASACGVCVRAILNPSWTIPTHSSSEFI